MRIFVDSDVVISSLLSSIGAAHFLLHNSQIKPFVSNFSIDELRIVIKRLLINESKFEKLIKNQIEIINLSSSNSKIKKEYSDYVIDQFDAHIVAGAIAIKTKFLVTYNTKHFKTEKIKTDYDILVINPAMFLQYFRSH